MENSGALLMTDSRQVSCLVDLAHILSAFLRSQPFTLLDLMDSLLLYVVSLLPSLYPFLTQTCMDKRLPASANPHSNSLLPISS